MVCDKHLFSAKGAVSNLAGSRAHRGASEAKPATSKPPTEEEALVLATPASTPHSSSFTGEALDEGPT